MHLHSPSLASPSQVLASHKARQFPTISPFPLTISLLVVHLKSGRMLCKDCQDITLSGLRHGFTHAASFRALQKSSKTCPLCTIFWKAVVSNINCEPFKGDITTIHNEPIVLEAITEKFSSKIVGIYILSRHEILALPERVFGKVSVFVDAD